MAAKATPLDGITVLDLSRVLAGPWCTQLLADLGATVIKVERPGSGDDTRAWGPPYLKDAQGCDTSEAAYYLSCNRGKHSVAIDFGKDEGRDLVRSLSRDADVFVENFKVGGLAARGLGYDDIRAINPRIVYASITGFGQQGPYAARAGYDFIIQAMSGFMSVTGERDDLPGGGPQKAGVAITDLMTGMYTAVAIEAALIARAQSGEGCHIDAALFDTAVATMSTMAMNYLATGVSPRRAGNAHPNIVPYQVFEAADGPLVVAVGNDAQFARFAAIAGAPQWAGDPRFARNAERVRNRAALVPMIAEAMRGRPRAHWLAALEAADIPAGPINTLAEAFADPQLAARGLAFELPHPLAGRVPQVGLPFAMRGGAGHTDTVEAARPAEAAGPVPPTRVVAASLQPPPLLGEHTREVLAAHLALDDAALAALAQRGVIQVRDS